MGYILNSVNVSTTIIAERVRDSRAANLHKVVQTLNDHRGNLAQYLSEDGKGSRLPHYLQALTEHLDEERAHYYGHSYLIVALRPLHVSSWILRQHRTFQEERLVDRSKN